MHAQVMKWISIAALLLSVVFWSSASNYQMELNVVVSIAAAVVLVQAFQVKKYRWAMGFLVIALLFNPAVPVFRLAGSVGIALVVLSIAPFAISLIALRPHRLLSIPSITDRTPGSQSL
jgi:uncharacterized protein DUF6804